MCYRFRLVRDANREISDKVALHMTDSRQGIGSRGFMPVSFLRKLVLANSPSILQGPLRAFFRKYLLERYLRENALSPHYVAESEYGPTIGKVDGWNKTEIRGWAADERDRDRIIEVELRINDIPVNVVRAELYRKDLEEAGYGNGCRGFLFNPLPYLTTAYNKIEVVVHETGLPLSDPAGKYKLPEFSNRSSHIRDGRNPYEGYQRGCALQNRPLGVAEKIQQDPLYVDAMALSHSHSVVSDINSMNIFLIIKFFFQRLPEKHIIEFGAYKGGNAIFMAYCLKVLYPGYKVFALDTFEGMPPTDPDLDLHSENDFSDVNFLGLQKFLEENDLDNLVLVRGPFQETADSVYRQKLKFGLGHIDCDIYSAVKFAQGSVWPHLCDGGYLVYDDACTLACLGATQAVEEFIIDKKIHSEQIWPHFVFRKIENQTT